MLQYHREQNTEASTKKGHKTTVKQKVSQKVKMLDSRIGSFGIILTLFLLSFVFNRISAVTKGIIELIEDDTKAGEV